MHIENDVVLDLELPYRERLMIRRTRYVGARPGPRIALVTGVHGDELEGLYLCHRLGRALEDLEATHPGALHGTVELWPGLNPLGLDTLKRFVPIFDLDLNRTFPGHPEGILPQRVAAATIAHLTGADLVVDIHASNIYLREIPQVRINTEFAERLTPMAQGMNLDLIWLHGAMTVLEATLAHSLNAVGTPCLVVEMGVGMRVTPQYTDQLLTGILHTAQNMGALASEVALPPLAHHPLIADDRNVHYLNAETSGLFIPEVEHWEAVASGQRLGRIVSPHHGEVLSEVCAPVDGILFTLREYPLVYEGSLMARIKGHGPEAHSDGEVQP
ncbi:MAG: succinylglutamate desuccinylase [Alphaproteobacteria bacterium CG_4_10_14_0_2_um_filter_63_37]|nr:MAG: succinylglutamate desuccinylase [Proteobacteria bacterium CG1_02_64_396]PJA23583.1 MAG: succinylglutamate desuccinylase [Alphaproteobacteria bacterium CG_4_10_14_0_2_um_filter_63_37]